eukprot:TRINITY_DN22006_c0_g1_i1.p1 TRINITY_DN22006_c0_g1~~TRINITY_DN22006_c0_g1_i1.p1  ORF type:complete len:392 (+),score=168.82 TRINITY_DN22006_c0_g1_i1:45-1220(+)
MSYLARAPAGIAGFLGNVGKLRGLKATYNNWLQTAAPVSATEQTDQIFSWFYQSWQLDEQKRIVVSEDCPMSRKEFTEMCQLQRDLNIMMKPMIYTGMCGGLSLVLLPEWASAAENLPSNFFKTEEEKKAWHLARDQEVHIKHAPLAAHTQSRFLEFFISNEAKYSDVFDSIADGFGANKDPVALKKMGQFIAKQHTCSLGMVTADVSSWHRGREHMDASNFLGLPFTFLSAEALSSRVIDHYKMLYQEDALINKEGVASLSDYELYEVCNRRLIARFEEELSRATLEARLADWMTFTGKGENDEFRTPIRLVLCYQASYFRDPGFLEEDLSSLDKDSFPTAWNWAQNSFERRVEFESGPLADQVRAHLTQVEASEKKMTEERAAYLASKA